MFSEVFKLVPKIDEKALRSMQNTLQSRFTKVAKTFGKGLVGVLSGGGIAGAALALVDKLLNPLKETQEAIDRMLKSSDDIATNANQFNTSTGKLFKLVQLAKSTGLDEGNLFTLITKFQTAVAEAKANPSSPSAVRAYANDTDMADSFFQFIQSLKTMEKNQQVLVQSQVFGEKQILRMADFLQTDFSKQMKATGLDKISSAKFGTSIDKMGSLNDLADALMVKRESEDVIRKAGVINEGIIRAKDKSERLALEKENQRIQSYQDLATISDTTNKIFGVLEKGLGMLGSLITTVTPAINRIVEKLESFGKSPTMRGMMKLFGKDE